MTHWIVLVPQGAEAKAVRRGLARRSQPSPTTWQLTLIEIPAGTTARSFLETQFSPPESPDIAFLILGLCGSLSKNLPIGTPVLYTNAHPPNPQPWPIPTPFPLIPVLGSTSDRILQTIADKQTWANQTGAAVVDMEGQSILTALQRYNRPIITLRIISDDLSQNLPDLSNAFTPQGQLQPLEILRAFAQKPIAALHLIRGSLKALQQLEQILQMLPFDRSPTV